MSILAIPSTPSLRRQQSSPPSPVEEEFPSPKPTSYFTRSDSYQKSLSELETFLAPSSLSKCTVEEKAEYAKIAFLLDESLQSFLKTEPKS
ncbi:hypothetical protein K493DRAFT_412282 [Basidiobolus meristosporus CBS 931.73]|uniref:Uncharacterized protein n=1 Tax=Basidiobolus meristosporus CBS 931.73 TaxID=1314790 RepID=A0A1Y1X1A0_9FUNG|nr:hypothetical protein K493DRAFT_412282 [Basidiobolus meristosporus CBS 931.73]|eukprot:ORX79196.1 hypothetical protein K493DRAFT_412282 [Basidiobolus meristosporus CBS 931.73]